MDKKQNGAIAYWRNRSLYLNITNRCTNNCIFCVKNYQEGVFGFLLLLTQEPTVDDIVNEINKHEIKNYNEIVFTGFGEPLLRLDVVTEVVEKIKENFPTIRIRVDTNGLVELIFPKRAVLSELSRAGITDISISLNAETKEKYLEICKPIFGIDSFDSILQFAEKCTHYFSVQFSVVNIPQIDINACNEIAHRLNIPLKIRHYSGPNVC